MYKVFSCRACNVCHCCFQDQVHALLELHYSDKWNKLAAAKKLAQAEGISVWEAEWCLNADLFLDEYPQWEASGPKTLSSYKGCLYMLRWQGGGKSNGLFTVATGNLTLGWMLRQQVPTIQLVGFKTTRDEIWELYNNVYQLKRSPGPLPYGPEQTEELVQGNLHLFKRVTVAKAWHSAQPKEEPEWGPTSTLRSEHQAEFPWRMWEGCMTHATVLSAKAREAHWQVLEAAHVLEEKIEWLSQSATRMRLTGQLLALP